MKKCFLTIFSLLFWIAVESSETSIQNYLELIESYPKLVQPQGKAKEGEIEIVLNKEKMLSIEKSTGRNVGIVAQDKYWLWINDACIFPSGAEGVYGRILWRGALETTPGVAVMAIMPDGKVVLNCNFRHATRSWEMELPRGLRNKGETIEAAAKREAIEETGMVVDSLFVIGEIPPDSGVTSTVIPVFVAKVVKRQSAQQEDTEAIEQIITLSIDEIKEAFIKGYYQCKIRGKEQRVFFRDPFLAYAVFMYELKKHSAK